MTDGHFVPSDTGSKPVVDIKDRDLITDHYKRKVDTRTTALSIFIYINCICEWKASNVL